MALAPTGNACLDKLADSYHPLDTKKKDKELGRDDFLTMMMAQLKYQDPLNPMDGTDFSTQLAQFSSLEQLINLNETMGSLKSSFDKGNESDVVSLVGKKVTGNVDSVELTNGKAVGGMYTLKSPGNVMITIYDSDGREIRSLFPGQQDPGKYNIKWDGTDNSGNKVKDGSYKYSVMANTGYGFEKVPTSVTGIVDSIIYNDGKPYLKIDGALVDPKSLVEVSTSSDTKDGTSSITDYLGKEITTTKPLAYVENGSVSGDVCSFRLDTKQDVVVNVYDSSGNIVKTMNMAAADSSVGINSVHWDGTDNAGAVVPDGLYTYSVSSSSGTVEQSISGEVSGIKYINGNQYLVLNGTGSLTGLSGITSVN